MLEQLPDNGDAIIALTEAARSKEDIQAAEQQLQKFPRRTTFLSISLQRICFFNSGIWSAAENALRQGAHRRS